MEQTPHPSIGLTIFSCCLLSVAMFHFMAFQTDTPSFVNAVEILLGESDQADRLFRLSKPLTLFFPILFYKILFISISYGFFIQQVLAYFLISIFLYKILFFISKEKNIAYIGMLAYLLCQPMAVYGLAMLTDGLGWLWVVISIWLILNILNQEKLKILYLIGLGAFLGLGFFIKESILVAGIFLFYTILLHPKLDWRSKIKTYLWVGISCIFTFILGSYWVYIFWNESIFQWVEFNHDTPPPFNFKNFILQSYHTLDVYWFLVPLGIWKAYPLSKENYIAKSMLITAITGWILLPLAWPYLYDRILFMNAPFLVLWIAGGATYFGKWALGIIAIGGLLNLFVTFGIYKYQIGGLILGSAMLFVGILFLVKSRF